MKMMDENEQIILEVPVDSPRRLYQAPRLRILEAYDIAGGSQNVPESDNGMIQLGS